MNIYRALLDFLCVIVALITIATFVCGIVFGRIEFVFMGFFEAAMTKGLFDMANKLSDGRDTETTGKD